MTTTTMDRAVPESKYPTVITVDAPVGNRNRLTAALRPILSIPHMILVGPGAWFHRLDSAGLIGAAAYVLAIVNWFSLLVTGGSIKGIRDFQLYYLRWRTRALAYMGLLVDQYPPFGDGPYPATIEVTEPTVRDRASIAVRLILAVPHLVVLFFLVLAWALVTVGAWLAILFTARYPASLHPFALGVMRWVLRVEAYLLLLVDEYPPFTLE
jgi:hypothetical protein